MGGKSLEIRLLGEFALYQDGRELGAPTLKKARILIAHLALNPGHEFVRDDLSAHLWPDAEIDKARFNLRQLLARIRRAAPELSPCLAIEGRTTIRLERTLVATDAVEFKRLVGSEPETAVALYRGPLLGGLDDEWLEPARAELERMFVGALESLADRSAPREAVSWLRRAIECDPYCDPLQQKLLCRLAECGDLTGVRMAYRTFQDRLHRGAHLAPSIETERLYRRLLADKAFASTPLPKATAGRRLPVPAGQIYGRDLEIWELSRQLKTDRMVTLIGPGGSGKTRLAIEVGVRELADRPAGVCFVDFSSLHDPARIPHTVGRTLGLRDSSGMEWIDAVAESIGDSDRLLIFDNCEHVVAGSAQVAEELVSRCGRVRILATSRVPLGVPGEQRFAVPPLALPDGRDADLAEYGQFSALELFEARARLVSPRFTITPANAARVVEICREVDALPLGIEMAAARLAALSLDEVARRLVDKLSFLKAPARAGSPRHQTLGSVVQWSYDLLSQPAKSLLTRLSVFVGGWTIVSAEAVCGFGDLAANKVLDGLVELVECSLVQRSDERYSLPETVRHFAANRLREGGEENESRDRHLRFFACLCEDVQRRIAETGPDRAANHYGPDLDNIRTALSWSAEDGEIRAALELAANAALVFSTLHISGEAAEWLTKILARETLCSEPAARIPVLASACRFFAFNYGDPDRLERTARTCEELIELATRTGHRQELADALCDLAMVRKSLGSDDARQLVSQSLAIHQSLPGGGNSHVPLFRLGSWAQDAGDFDEAGRFFDEAAAQARKVEDFAALILVLESKSHLLREHCDHEGALQLLREAGHLARVWGDAGACAFNSLRFAELHLDRWDFADLGDPLARARSFYEETRSSFHLALIDGLSRYLAAHEGRVRDAAAGVSAATARLIAGGYRSSWAWWHGACIEMEALAYCLSRNGAPGEGAWFFGAAQAFRGRDGGFLSESVRNRWRLLSGAAGFGSFAAETTAGFAATPEQVLVRADSAETFLVGRM